LPFLAVLVNRGTPSIPTGVQQVALERYRQLGHEARAYGHGTGYMSDGSDFLKKRSDVDGSHVFVANRNKIRDRNTKLSVESGKPKQSETVSGNGVKRFQEPSRQKEGKIAEVPMNRGQLQFREHY
jgi:hypothetical protein